jgi:hypothetical protein
MTVSKTPRTARKTVRANADRGEHEIILAGTTYLLRPSFAACAAIEEELGKSLIEVMRAANMMSLNYFEIGICLAEFIRAGASDDLSRNVAADRIAELVFEEGSASAMARLTLILADTIGGGRDVEGNVKAPTSAKK